MDWQPIDTAPKRDGLPYIDLWITYPDGSGQRIVDCFWQGEWVSDNEDNIILMKLSGNDGVVTHWMPRDEGPK